MHNARTKKVASTRTDKHTAEVQARIIEDVAIRNRVTPNQVNIVLDTTSELLKNRTKKNTTVTVGAILSLLIGSGGLLTWLEKRLPTEKTIRAIVREETNLLQEENRKMREKIIELEIDVRILESKRR
jgi:predicted RNase H-related nuclease YkuK (DUF458 family)